MSFQIYLSPPHLNGEEIQRVEQAFAKNWVAPAGPALQEFEREICRIVGVPHAVALSSATAALHLSLIVIGIRPGDEVLVSDFTFVASVNPILYVGGRPVFVDSDRRSWNLDPNLLEDFLAKRARVNRVPKALILVHIYGQAADLDPILELCRKYEIFLIEDVAEALGTTYKDRAPGSFGDIGVFSFNGNKIVTTSGGGMMVSHRQDWIERAHHLATQAREKCLHFEHKDLGYNYRLSNISACIGLAQLRNLQERVRLRREIFDRYVSGLADIPAVGFMPEAPYGKSTRWLSCLLLEPTAKTDAFSLCHRLAEAGIEARPLWKPMHRQSLYQGYEAVGGTVGEDLFARGLCLPSSSKMTLEEQSTVIRELRKYLQ